jgi:hypothetical protein
MLVTYFDEVKPCNPDQPYYWLGGLMIDDQVIPELEQEINSLAVNCFGPGTGLTKQTEFHATDIAIGCRNFKKARNPADRFEILKQLVRIYDKPDGVYRVTIRLNVAQIYSGTDTEELAMMYLVEKVNNFARSKRTRAMLIGDFEKEKIVNKAVQSLARYKEDGTPFAFGHDIDHLIDTVHFSHSHNSRLLQLADTYMWTQQLRHRVGEQSELRADLIKFINEETDTNWEHKYKYWPAND